MKQFFEIMRKDIMSEHFTNKQLAVYGILAPVALLAIMALAGWMETSLP